MIKIGLINHYSKKHTKLNHFKWQFHNTNENMLDLVKKVCQDRYEVFDCDQCGDNTYYYVVGEEGVFRFFKVKHSWYWASDESEEDRGYYVENTFDYEEIKIEDIPIDVPPLV